MKLQPKQSKFLHMLALLTLHTEHIGYQLTQGRGYASEAANKADGGIKNSGHRNRLAQDFNVFKDGVYLKKQPARIAFNKMHDYWDSIGGAKRIKRDLNHFSIEHNGVR